MEVNLVTALRLAIVLLIVWFPTASIAAERTVDDLINALRVTDPEARAQAAQAIGNWLNPPAEISGGFSDVPVNVPHTPKRMPFEPIQVDRVADALAPLFSDANAEVRIKAGEALARLRLKTARVEAGILRDERFLPQLEVKIKAADSYTKIHLEACARACGKVPDHMIKLSKDLPEGFRPKSAWPGTDPRREAPKFGGHGDGYTSVLVTGRLLSADGSPAKSPKFFATHDRMLLGMTQNEPQPLPYNEKTGKFVYLTRVFAAFARGEGQAEPGPYQTGTAQTRIEAEGADPLVIRFFDEMPEIEITLPLKASAK